jgi:phosphatidylserine/phosphatidylglycerophosphate/cardiolipin synthase-like enzyme
MPTRSRIISPLRPSHAWWRRGSRSPSMRGMNAHMIKSCILDGGIVTTGSYNWTVAAEKDNGENLLVIRDPRLAGVYTENWRRHAHHSTPYWRTAPWWTRIRVVWASLTRRRRKLLASDMGEEG